MNNYSFGHKVKDNSIIIQKLTNELSLIKDKLLLSQTQLNTLTIKYQNAINKNQKLKEQNLELSKKLQNIKENEEIYEIMDNLRKQVTKLSQKLSLSEEKQKQILSEKEILINENNKLKEEILKLKKEIEKIKKNINSNQINDYHTIENNQEIKKHYSQKSEDIDQKILERQKLKSKEVIDNLPRRHSNIELILSDKNLTSQNIDKTINELKEQLKLTKQIKEQKNSLMFSYNSQIDEILFSQRNLSENKKEKNITEKKNKKEKYQNLMILKDEDKNLFRNTKKIIQTDDKINMSERANSFNLYSKKHIPNKMINLKKEKVIFGNRLKNNNNSEINLFFKDFSNEETLKKNNTIIEKKVSLESLKKNLIKEKLNEKKYFTSGNSIENYQVKKEKIKEEHKNISINNNNEINIGLYRLEQKTRRLIFFNIITKKFEFKKFINEDNFSFLKEISINEILIYSNNSGIYILTSNPSDEQNELYCLNLLNQSIEKFPNPNSYHKKTTLISFNLNNNNNNIICFSGSNTTSVEIFNILNKNWSYLPYLDNPHSDSSLLIIDNYKLFCFFGYDYVNNSFKKDILWIDLTDPKIWNKININLEIKSHFVFIPTNSNEKNVFYILGGVFPDNNPNSDMIQLICSGNNYQIYSNYNTETNYNEMFLFNYTFINYYDFENKILYKCGYDQKGNVHIIDTTNVKHHIFEYNENI